MKKIIIVSITFLLCGCSSYQEITEQDVKDTILGMFDSFSVESNDKSNFYNYVTDDYILYEMGKRFNASEFIDFANSFGTIEDDWTLSDMKISIDKESAHAYFKNKGRFVTLNEGKKKNLNCKNISTIDEYNIDGDFIESQAFAFLAIRSFLNLPLSFPETTGCLRPCTGGAIVEAK